MQHDSPSAILHDLECFKNMGSVLYIAAHPDDENTELLTFLARGRKYRAAYLSLTRGDGGQNVLGAALGEKLGLARTQELLAARRLDGAQQFFSRAIDFGFSKDYKETLKVWNEREVLSDMVRIIRKFHPDVLITRFSPSPGGTHGHHTASAVLALEAFKQAGNPKAFPELGLAPWQPKRIFWNIGRFQKDKAAGLDILKVETGGNDTVSGETFLSIAGKSRSMHKTQGFDTFPIPFTVGEPRRESFQLLDGVAVSKDIMDDVDSTWNRVPGGEVIGKSVDAIIAEFNKQDVSASVPALLKLRKTLADLKSSDPVVQEKQKLLDRILQSCLGLHVETTSSQHEVVPGETLKLHHVAKVQSKFPVRWVAVRFPEIKKESKRSVELHPNEVASADSVEVLPKTTPLTQPWWLRKEGTAGLFAEDDVASIGRPENLPAFPIEHEFLVDGQQLTIPDEPIKVSKNGSNEVRRRLDVIPPLSLRFTSDVSLMSPGGSKTIEVEVTAARAGDTGSLSLDAPREWKVSPQKQKFQLEKVGEKKTFKFTLSAPSHPQSSKIKACADLHGARYCSMREEIVYGHLPPQLLQSPASIKAVSVNLKTRGHTIGYLPGAGDSLAQNMQEMGCDVKVLDENTLTADQLKSLDAVVLGVRAFNTRANIGRATPLLFDYVEKGGTLIVQYNRPDNLKAEKIAPIDLHISSGRVTNEKAAITFLAPDNPVLNSPNKITSADFDGWVHERGLYFADKWDEKFTPIISCNDEGEPPLKGGLLVAKVGKGYYVYTGLAFFRQLPAGVPGAYRLFANLVSINK